MKKLLSIGAALAAAVLFAGCTSTVDIADADKGWTNCATIAVKDFDGVGIVMVESTKTIKVSPFRLKTETTGKSVTYSDLMAEAKKLGADDIINVRLDKGRKGGKASFFAGGETTYTYSGTALAIKYKSISDLKDVTLSNGTISVQGSGSTAPAKTGGLLSKIPLIGRIFK